MDNVRDFDGLLLHNPYYRDAVYIREIDLGSIRILREDGSVWSAGGNAGGGVGDGTATAFLFGGRITQNNARSTPVRIFESGARSIHSASGIAYVIMEDNSLWGWGTFGTLPDIDNLFGVPNPANRLSPVRLMEDVVNIGLSSRGLQMIIKTDGSLWGLGTYTDTPFGTGRVGGQNTMTATQPLPERIMDGIMLPGGAPIAPKPPTADAPSAWAVEQVNAAIAAGLVPPHLQARYTQAITRAEFSALAVALYETAMGREVTGRMSFNDTNDVNVQKMGYLGVVTGVGGDNFNPTGQLTREQAAVILARLADAMGQPLPTAAPTFADNSQISSWALDAVGQMQASGIMGGVGDNQFAPQGDYTIEQSIITILRLFTN